MGHCISPDPLEIIFGGIPCDFFIWDEAEGLASKTDRNGRASPPPQPATLRHAALHSKGPPQTLSTGSSGEQSSASMPSTAQLAGSPLTTVIAAQCDDRSSVAHAFLESSVDPTNAALRQSSATIKCDQTGTLFAASIQNHSNNNAESEQTYSTVSPKRPNNVRLPPKLPSSLSLVCKNITTITDAQSTGLKTLSPRTSRVSTARKSSNLVTTYSGKSPLTPTKSFLSSQTASPSHHTNQCPPVPPTSLKLRSEDESVKENTDPSLAPTSPGGDAKEEASPLCPSTAPALIPESESWEELGLRVMAVLPGKLGPAWYASHIGLLNCDNTLPAVWRHYIALVALCRHEVPWAARLLALEFLKAGGDIEWLTSYTRAPVKLQRVMSLNNLLAHQPWSLTASHIQALCCEGEDEGISWSYSEAMLAALLLSHHHALAAFLLCCPLLLPPPAASASPAPLTVMSPKRATSDEEDYPDSEEEDDTLGLERFIGLTFNLANASDNSSVCSSLSSSPCRVSVLTSGPSLSSAAADGGVSSNTKAGAADGLAPPPLQQHSLVATGVKVARFGGEKSVSSRPASPITPLLSTTSSAAPPMAAAAASKQTTDTLQATARSGSQPLQSAEEGGSHPRPPAALFPGLVKEPDVGYKHFPHHLSDENSPCISGNSFRWIDYGFDSIRRLLGEECLACELDDRFTASSELGHRTSVRGELLCEKRISGPCHKPVWRQVQWLLGVLHDDYDYRLLRRTMSRNLHHLIRTATCFPKRLTSMPRPELQQHDMIAVCAQIMDVRVQAEVMFAVRAITRCYTTNRRN